MTDIISQQRYNKEDMNKALEALREGGSVLFPSELGWVVGCDASNTAAVRKMLELNEYFESSEAVLLIDNPAKLSQYIQEVPELAWDLIELSEKPLSIILTRTKNLADQVNGNTAKVAFRVTSGFFAQSLCTRFRTPIFTIQIMNNLELLDELSKLVTVHVTYEDAEPIFLSSQEKIQLDKGNIFKIIK